MAQAPDSAQIGEAWDRIRPYIHRTPVIETTEAVPGVPLSLKLEHMQKSGSFKVRGAFNSLLSADVPEAGVVAASGGNHGAAVALAATRLDIPAKIFVPEMAGPSKIGVIQSTGADLTVVPGAYANALEAALEHEARTGAMQIHAYDGFRTVEGQGTAFAEWEDQGLDCDTVLVAVGGGGLISGAMSWFGDSRKIIAVEPETAPTLNAALEAGGPVDVEVSGIAANALGARRIGSICYDLASSRKIDSLLVPDDAIADAQVALWSGLRQWVEPAAAAALAAIMSGAYTPASGERLAVIVCGANPAPGPFG
ncbi:threonine/serine dehydratase [Pelagovum pacificum]|uniref:Threonine/serine dehydratase n=1 Tax=Pelagovum pacificum TaxID=2588711 RepID=A0A5C5GK53_9RHOB|nr:threonine/serine dehydratase [Pelagovum pacificum]QQA42657.1 threonine/serine dehydratase [Pelagovum pacificum]TNY34191.1 threonine/serine dehydratase [Pelagovum pacificum]